MPETGNLKKNHVLLCPPVSSGVLRRCPSAGDLRCPPVSSGAPNGICKISQSGRKNPIRAELESAVSEQLSITRKLRSNGQTRQRWSNMNQYSVTVMPIFSPQMFSETSCSVLFSCKMRRFVTRQPCWDQLRKYQAPPTSRSKSLNWSVHEKIMFSSGVSPYVYPFQSWISYA